MRLRDTFWLSVKGISQRKTRTALTVLTVVIGVAAIVALISLVAGASASISKSLESIGPTTLFVEPRAGTLFTAADVAEISGFPNVSAVIPLITADGNATIGGQAVTFTLVGVNNYSLPQAIGSIKLLNGTLYNQSALPEAVVGYDVAFPTSTQSTSSVIPEEPIYMTLRTASGSKSLALVPVGILDEYGSAFFVSPDTSIFTSLAEAEQITGRDSYSSLLVIATNSTSVTALDSLLTDVLGSSASVISVSSIASTVTSVIGSISLLLGSVAGVSLLVAGISILSIMMVSVTERTKEIGTLKALGFRSRDILVLFLTEAVIIGFLGGVLGVAAGAGGAYGLGVVLSHASSGSSSASSSGASGFGGGGSGGGFGGGDPSGGSHFNGGSGGGGDPTFASGGGTGAPVAASTSSTSSGISLTPVFSLSTIILAIAVAMLVSVVSTLYPAWKAARVDPITALRTE